ncbi:MAG: hypothetical protein CUR32_11060 [Flavobacterium sp.]|nr:MAG: hypothetical protein CUR32_11060 [Flavobacterium sp.] [Flavobacterium sp. FEMGT703F]
MEVIETQNTFVKNFIYKAKKDRALFELNSRGKRIEFLRKLNHSYLDYLDETKLTLIQKKEVDDFLYIKENLKVRETDLCLVISNYREIDNKIMTFKDAFDEIYGFGLASLLVFENAEKIYLQTEQEQGAPNKYIGKNQNYR